MKRLVIFFLVLTSCGFIHAQGKINGNVRGKVMDAASSGPLENVTIAVYSMPDSSVTKGVATGMNGEFSVTNLPVNEYILVPSFVGYESKIIRFGISEESPEMNIGEIILKESAEDIGDVTVTAAKPQIVYRDNKKIISVKEFQDAGATTLAEVLENAPSVTLDHEGNVLLRGSSNYTLLIDGKPVPATGANLLRQIPPDMVENIEIMTNPSAKYDPDGVTGIINLVLKKETKPGMNGQFSAMAGLGDKYNGDIQLNYNKNKVSIYGGITGTAYNTYVGGDIYRLTGEAEDTVKIDNYLNQQTGVNTIIGNFGLDLSPDDNNSITISGRFGPQSVTAFLDNQIERSVSDPLLTGKFNFSNELSVDGIFYMPGLTWDHNFGAEGHKIQLSAFAGGFDGDLTQVMTEEAADNSWISTGLITDKRKLINEMSINDIRIKADYELPVSEKGKLQAGLQQRLLLETNDHVSDYYDFLSGHWVEDPMYSNRFELNRGIYSAYLIWGGKAGKYSYQAGLRGEYTDRTVKQDVTGDATKYTKFNFFPSANISRNFNDKIQLQLSYSRRVNRPVRGQLNAFPQYADNQYIVSGNPGLVPEFIDSYELSFQDQIKIGFFSAEAYYRRVNDLITGVLTPGEDGTMIQNFINANRSQSAGTELMANIQPVAWLRLIASGNVYYYKLDDELIYGENKNESLIWNSNITSVFLPTKTTRLTLTAVYNGPSITLQGSQEATYMINMGIRQELFKRKASVSLGIRDLFSTFVVENEIRGEGYTTFSSLKPESRITTLTFTYNLNNYRQRAQDETMDLNFIR